ncbi:tetratricopeptide repeat protein [Streptomyces violaceusniger]|uniref:tetratricopeptide repeat protein n=1 Tax=Streptomyces violaceusniger TaxID=68280 RepID=UPI0036825DD0
MSGAAHDVVQARDVHGGVHFHASNLPPLPAVPVPRQLPADVRGFIGRTRELGRLEALTGEDRPEPQAATIIIAGTAGAGKTALAVHWAHRLRDRFCDGQLFVNLRGYDAGPLMGPQAALDRFLRALDVPPQAIPADLEARADLYRSLLADKRILVILDNVATAAQVRPLMPGNAQCLLLITSRNRLTALAARDGAHRLTLGMLSEAESVELVTAATAEHRTGDDQMQRTELARLCAHLPLALRIAAERAAARPWMPLPELINDLRQESSLWDALSTEDGEEADAVRSVFAWSYRALPPPVARTFRLLGLHPGPEFGIPATAALTQEPLPRLRGLLDTLVGAHLLEQTGPDRYQFHDLLRAYATTQAHQDEAPQDRTAAIERIATWYLHTADAATRAVQSFYPSVLTQPPADAIHPLTFEEHDTAMLWYRTEQANLLSTARAATEAGLDEIAWKLPATLYGLHVARSPLDDWEAMSHLGLQAAQRLQNEKAQATLHQSLGVACVVGRKFDEAAEHLQTALDSFTAQVDTSAMADAITALGFVHLERHRPAEAHACCERALALAQDSDDRKWTAVLLGNLARTSLHLGRLEQAAQLAEQSIDLHQVLGTDRRLRISPLLLLARAHREAGRPSQATPHVQTALDIAQTIDFPTLDFDAHLEHAATCRALGLHTTALEAYWRCVTIQRARRSRADEAVAYDGIGQTMHALGRHTEAIDFYLLAVRIHRQPHAPWNLAHVLDHLADAYHDTGQAERAATCRTEAFELLAAFEDPLSVRTRDRLRTLIPRQSDSPSSS